MRRSRRTLMGDLSFFWAPCFDVGAIAGWPYKILHRSTLALLSHSMVISIVRLMAAILRPLGHNRAASILPTMFRLYSSSSSSSNRLKATAMCIYIRPIRIPAALWPVRPMVPASLGLLGSPHRWPRLRRDRCPCRHQQCCHRPRRRLKRAPAALDLELDLFRFLAADPTYRHVLSAKQPRLSKQRRQSKRKQYNFN